MDDGRVECTLVAAALQDCRWQLRDSAAYAAMLAASCITDNYGKAVAAAEEVIETEAIYHYRPGARILSMGNIGCMMSCRFCQNWTTSQVKHLDERVDPGD